MYSQLQPWIRPELVNLMEQRIDVISMFLVIVGDKQEDQQRWCQGVVKLVLNDSRKSLVIIKWDGVPDVESWENRCESAQQLLPSLYNKDKEGAWRIDVIVELCKAYDSDNDDCYGSDDEISSDDNEMSEEEDNIDDTEEGLSDVSESDDSNFHLQ